MATAFGTQGATPQTALLPGLGGTPVATTPAAKALSSAQTSTSLGSSFFGAPVGSNAGALGSTPTPTTSTPAASSGINWNAITVAPPQTPGLLQKQTVTQPDGTTVSHTYDTSAPSGTSATGHTTALPGGDTAQAITPAAQATPTPDYGSQQYSPANNPSYTGLVGAGANASQTAATVGSQEQQDAYAAAQKYQDELSGLMAQQSLENSNINASPMQIDFKQGQAAGLQSLFQGQENAAATGLQSESNLANTGVTSQGQGISGLGTSAGLLSPSNEFIQQSPSTTLVGANGQPVQQATPNAQGVFTNALTGASLPTTGNPKLDNAVANALQAIKAGAGYDNAVSQAGLGTFGPNGANALNNALPPGFNVNASNASAAAQATNIGTVGTTQKTAAAQGYTQALQQQADATAKYQALTGVSGQVESTLGTWANKYSLTAGNKAINTIAGLTSDPNYQPFLVALGNTQAAYQAVLGSTGVTPTKADSDALQALNPNSSGTAIISALNQLSKDAHSILVEPAYTKTQSFAQQLGIQ